MMKVKKTAVLTTVSVAVALAGLVGTQVPASAQQKTYLSKKDRTLVVRRRHPMAAPIVAAPAAVTPVGVASTVVGAPFMVLNSIFPAPGPRSGGVTAVRYANAGAEQAKIDEGFAEPVPVDRSGPIFVVQNGDPTVSPMTFIGAPIAAIGSLTQVPFKILGAAAPVL